MNTTEGLLDKNVTLVTNEQQEEQKGLFDVIVSVQIGIGLAGWLLVYPVMIRSKELSSAAYKLIISLGVNDGLLLFCYLANLVLSRQEKSSTQIVVHGWFTKLVVWPLWHSFQAHLLMVATNRVICIVLPRCKDTVYGGMKVFFWVGICWVVFAVSAVHQIILDTNMTSATECIMMYGGDTNVSQEMNFAIVDLSAASTVLVAYLAVAIKIRLSSAESRHAKKKEIGISVQQGIVFSEYALTIVTWYLLANFLLDERKPCATFDLLAIIDVMNYITAPMIYLTFNSTLRQEVLRSLRCTRTSQVDSVRSDDLDQHTPASVPAN